MCEWVLFGDDVYNYVVDISRFIGQHTNGMAEL